MRMTVVVRNVEGVAAAVRARNRAQFARIREVTAQGLDRVLNRAQELCPRDTHYMALNMRAELTRNGLNFAVGWRREDFVGQTNTEASPPFIIRDFYPVFVVFGTRFMAGRDPIGPALRAERANLLRGYARAIGTTA